MVSAVGLDREVAAISPPTWVAHGNHGSPPHAVWGYSKLAEQ